MTTTFSALLFILKKAIKQDQAVFSLSSKLEAECMCGCKLVY